ncbi:MAG: ZIP family metal transporter [Pseudomonadota bacterium]
MSAAWLPVLLLSLLSALTTWLGVMLALRLRGHDRAIALGIGFSTGIMLLIALLELVPASTGRMGVAPTLLSFALGAGLVWTLHRVVPHTHLVAEPGMAQSGLVKAAYLVAFGLILHDVPEGFAMANAYIATPELGLLVALAIALHNVPEEFAMALPFILIRRPRLLYRAALLSALAEPLGAILGLAALGLTPGLHAHFMAFAAGAMVFVALHELLPMARHYGNRRLFAAGLALSLPVYALLGTLAGGG